MNKLQNDNMAALPLKSSQRVQRAVVCFLRAKGHNAHAIHGEMHPVYGDKWPDEENVGWIQICLRYGGAMGRSSVACTAADFVFFPSGIHKLVER